MNCCSIHLIKLRHHKTMTSTTLSCHKSYLHFVSVFYHNNVSSLLHILSSIFFILLCLQHCRLHGTVYHKYYFIGYHHYLYHLALSLAYYYCAYCIGPQSSHISAPCLCQSKKRFFSHTRFRRILTGLRVVVQFHALQVKPCRKVHFLMRFLSLRIT